VQTAYGHLLTDGMDILDLMAGQTSHLPSALKPRSMTGLGLNKREMEDNTALTANSVHNLNEDPKLPFADNSFDAIISTGGIEYLTKPFEIFDEAARVLRPGGMFIVVFSNQWFQPKVVHIWRELLDFERMGLVSQYFIRSGEYEGITTYSDRGWSSSDAAKGEDGTPSSDPIYAVWATKR